MPRLLASSSSPPTCASCGSSWCAPPTCPPTCSTVRRTWAWRDATSSPSTAARAFTSRSTSALRSAAWSSRAAVKQGARLRVATKYIGTAREHFAAKGMHVDLIRLYGSMELAPLVGLADAIVDLVSSGNTLRANDLVAVEDIMAISARLIVNPASLKLKRDSLQPLLDAIARSAPSAPGTADVPTAASARSRA